MAQNIWVQSALLHSLCLRDAIRLYANREPHLGVDYEIVDAAEPKVKVIIAEFVRVSLDIGGRRPIAHIVIPAHANHGDGRVQFAKSRWKNDGTF